jgi:hypothetical protein
MDSFPISTLIIPEFISIDIKIIDFNALECFGSIDDVIHCSKDDMQLFVERQQANETKGMETWYPTIRN